MHSQDANKAGEICPKISNCFTLFIFNWCISTEKWNQKIKVEPNQLKCDWTMSKEDRNVIECTAGGHKTIDPTHWLGMYDVQIVLNYAIKNWYRFSCFSLEIFISIQFMCQSSDAMSCVNSAVLTSKLWFHCSE